MIEKTVIHKEGQIDTVESRVVKRPTPAKAVAPEPESATPAEDQGDANG
uniref:Uncharacterized protein n=1 Tax=viral metagenome TaxID=1070528 RepID=A0A6M3JAD1_9ZZZZ